MIYEYAVDPLLFISKGNAKFILEAFGRDKGRLISEIKKKHWSRLVRDAYRESGNRTMERHALTEALKKLIKNQKAIYCRQSQIEATNWKSMTEKAHEAWPYRGILVEQYEGAGDHCLVDDLQLADNPRWIAPPSITIKRKAKTMVAEVSPLLENAREVMLVDRNFKLENPKGKFVSRFKNVLVCFLNFLANKKYGPSVNKLTYQLGQGGVRGGVSEITDSVINNLKDQCDKYLKSNIPSNIKLEIAIWPWGELHDRFVLTDIGGVYFGDGLDEFVGSNTGSNKETVTLKRMSGADHTREWSKFKQKQPNIIL